MPGSITSLFFNETISVFFFSYGMTKIVSFESYDLILINSAEMNEMNSQCFHMQQYLLHQDFEVISFIALFSLHNPGLININ